MRDRHELHLIWLKELNLAVVAPRHEREESYAAAAVIIKGDDGADLFIPYDGYVEGAPIAFPLTRGDNCRISVLAFGHERDVVEVAAWRLNETLSLHQKQADGVALDVTVTGFGERLRLDDRIEGCVGADEAFAGPVEVEGDESEAVAPPPAQSASIGLTMLDYEIEGEVDYSDLLSTFLVDVRQVESERFTAFFVTAVPMRLPYNEGEASAGGGPADDSEVGPAVQLRPLHHYQFALQPETIDKPFERLDPDRTERAGGRGEASGAHRSLTSHPNNKSHPMAGAALVSRHGGFAVRHVPALTLYAGTSRESVEFALRNGFHLHWRRQLEGGGLYRRELREQGSFQMEAFSEQNSLVQHEGAYYFRWAWPEAVIGDVVGLKFVSDSAVVELDIDLGAEDETLRLEEGEALFLFLGETFQPLTKEVLAMAENQGLSSRLHGHIDRGSKGAALIPYLGSARAKAAETLFHRDEAFQKFFDERELAALSEAGPYGIELMVYRDHLLRTSVTEEMRSWPAEIKAMAQSGRRARLIETLKFERFTKAPAMAHALVFNPYFRERFKAKPIDPHSLNMPVLEYLMSQSFADGVIDWAMRLKGESQAILWQLCLKRPQMVERLYELKLEPDLALNPFDERSLDMAEAALNDSSGIDTYVIEKKVIPIFQSLGEERRVEELSDFARALAYGAEGKALSLGELSVCLEAVELAQHQWDIWREQGRALFSEFLAPLELVIPEFKDGGDYSLSERLEPQQLLINNLSERLARELNIDDDILAKALGYIKQMKIGSLLGEIEAKLDLALKYHHDLEIGVAKLYASFDSSVDQLRKLVAIPSAAWPDVSFFPKQFAAPLEARRAALGARFEAELTSFAESVHPGDGLFLSLLRTALEDLQAGIALLAVLETGRELEERRETLQKRLKLALLSVSTQSVKLRQSASLPRTVRDIIIAERQGPLGWAELSHSLDRLEQDLKGGDV